MSWQGTILGGGIGLMFGPLGAAAGAAAGKVFIDQRRDARLRSEQQKLVTYLGAALFELSLVDGPMNLAEAGVRELLVAECNEMLARPLPRDKMQTLLEKMVGIPSAARLLSEQIHKLVPQGAAVFFARFMRLAAVDGNPLPIEDRWLQSFAALLALPADFLMRLRIVYIRGLVGGDREAAAQMLGVEPGCPADELRRAYHQASLRYHPDLHPGLSPEIAELTAEKFRAVQEAYQLLNGAGARAYRALAPDGGAMTAAAADAVVRCALCQQNARLPDAAHLGGARCPRCCARLTFTEEELEKI